MAAPNYTEDLTDIDLGESTTGWSAWGGGASGLGTGPDFAIQGTNAIDKQITSATKGMMHNDATVSLGASDHIWGWIFAATPGILDTLANGGKRMSIGTGTTDRNDYYLEGSDTRPEGGNKCYCVRYSTSTPSPGSQTGTPGATPTYFGGGLATTGTAKGVNLGLDAFRYGTGAYITAGDGTTPATFAGFATQDESVSNKWGILFRVNGTFQWQGRFVVGQDNTGTATAAHFDDSSGAVITLTDTPHSQTDFTQLIIDHASTVFNLSGATFIGLGTNNPGKVVINNASASSTGFENCTWRNFGTIQGHANVDYDGCTFVGTDQIDQNGGTFSNCRVENNTATAAILSSNPGLISGTTFISDGTGHAIEIDTAGTYTLTNNSYVGYAGSDGSTGNEVIYNNSGGAVTINVSGGNTPTIRNGASATTTVNNTVTLTFNGIVSGSRLYIEADTGGPETAGTELYNQNVTANPLNIDYDFSSNQPVIYRVRKGTSAPYYKPLESTGTITSTGFTATVNQISDS